MLSQLLKNMDLKTWVVMIIRVILKNYPIVAVSTAFYLDENHNMTEIIRGPEEIDIILVKLDISK